MVVTPAVSAASEFAKPAGVPIMKSPRCGWMAAASPSRCHSDGFSSGPVSLWRVPRSDSATLIARDSVSPKRSHAMPASASPPSTSSSTAAVAAQSVEPIWMWYMTRPSSRARCLTSASDQASKRRM